MKKNYMAENIFLMTKYFGINNQNYSTDFSTDFKKFVKSNIDINKQDISYGKLYNSSRSYIFYPHQTIENTTKNILLVSHELSRTGAPIVVLDTARLLVKNGFFVTVISLKDGPLLNDFLDIGVPVIIMPEMKQIQYFHSETSHFFQKMDLDVFVANFDVTIMITATLYNFVRRYFNTNYNIYWWIHEGSESYNILGNKMPKSITNNIKVLCGGDYAAKQLENRGFLYYPKILNYGVFDESQNIIKNKKLKDQKIKFLLAGTIGKRKGQLVFLEAIQLIPEKYQKNAEFILIGDPYENDIAGIEIKEQIEIYAKNHSNVILKSSIPRKQLYQMYQEIDVLVLASIDDPMPVVATENFMLNNICLCSDHTGTSYYINDKINSFTFKSEDSKELAEKIIYIMDHKSELDNIKKNSRKIYDNYFSINVFEKNILNLIQGGQVK